MTQRRVLIIGNMGYVGPVLCRHLRQCWPDAELIGLDAAWFAQCLTADELPERVLDSQWFLDARDLRARHLEGVDAVVYLAAVSNDPMGERFAQVTLAINQQAALAIAALCRQAGVGHFVFASSCSVYGYAESGRPRSESDPLDPLTAYAQSKVRTEQALAASDDGRMVTTCLRFATACGISPRLRLDLVLNDFVAAALTTGAIAVLSDGTPWRPLIDVSDMALAIEWALTRTQDAGGSTLIVNAGSDAWNYQVTALADAVAKQTGTQVSINHEAPPDRRSYRVDFNRFRELAPCHQPQINLDISIARLIALLQDLRFDDASFRQSSFMRLNVLRSHVEAGRMNNALRWQHAV